MLYITIHQLREKRLRITQISKQLKLSRNTVYKYLSMTFEEAVEEFGTLNRKKKLDPYRDWIVNWLQEYPSLSGAQIYDWLLERFPDLEVGESTVRRYVNEMREIYHIDKKHEPRVYEAVEELPPGKQLQVDWGQAIQKTMDKKEIKLYFIAFVLAHSRQKYMVWQDHPFTTQDAIRCHEHAFRYYDGMPEEIVYDQDNLISVSENAGDLLLTAEFQRYVNQRRFNIYLCRKADPESKGKIENVVKYIKHNFAKHRVYSTLESWNERALQWLERTGNYKVHHTIKKRPVEVFLLEKQHLKPVSPSLSIAESKLTESITRNVNKDNTIRYRSNRYSVPVGTYTACTEVKLHVKEHQLTIVHAHTGEVITRHNVCTEKGKFIKNTNHSRDHSLSLQHLKQEVLTLISHEKAEAFIKEIYQRYGRYRRDQLLRLKQVALEHPHWIHRALERCLHEKWYSANDVRDVVAFLKRIPPETVKKPITASKQAISIPVHTRDVKAYLPFMGGKADE